MRTEKQKELDSWKEDWIRKYHRVPTIEEIVDYFVLEKGQFICKFCGELKTAVEAFKDTKFCSSEHEGLYNLKHNYEKTL